MQRAVWKLAQAMAVLGGCVLLSLVCLTCVSILGRLLNSVFNSEILQSLLPGFADWARLRGIGPVVGDVELMEAGVAFAIFAFLPLCQLSAAHASVDLFTDRLPVGLRRWLIALIDVVFCAVLILIAWRLSEGMLEKRAFSETSFMLQYPLWWAYAASLIAASLAAAAGLFVAAGRVAEAVTGKEILCQDQGPSA
ncbi:MAG: TRAP transporter small permease [Pseudomonadota bacterium]